MRQIVTREQIQEQIRSKIIRLYGADKADGIITKVFALLQEHHDIGREIPPLSEQDVILIVYGDHVRRAGETPLATLHGFLRQTVYPTVSGVHILPFFPYSSDDGFSVIDYTAVNPDFGDWPDVRALGQDFRLMFDAVFNHISAHSAWFQAFLRDEAPYRDYFIVTAPNADLSQVVRPRALPLLTPFDTPSGKKYVWTTFSDDQIDLNFANPDVLLDALRILLFYVRQGADLIRLDAIAFLWKIIGTTCIHLEETHLVVQLMRDVLDMAAPSVQIITETNVPHEENISYFGDGQNEAQMVYQFPLAPLVFHTFISGDATKLSAWAASLERVSDATTFFNFTASHDGIGLRPATGILSPDEINTLLDTTQRHGGFVSYKANSDGSQSPYELNITYFDAITDPAITAVNPGLAVQRFIASQAIQMVMIGVPGIYFHNLFGGRNDRDGVQHTGRYRTINRQKLDADHLLAQIDDKNSIPHRVFTHYLDLLKIRTREAAFHPLGTQVVHTVSPAVFALERISPDGAERVCALTNVTGEEVSITVPLEAGKWRDLIGGPRDHDLDSPPTVQLAPYQTRWLKRVYDE